MREKEIERKLRQATLKRGGLCLKFVSPGWAGAPDRLVVLPGGKMGFVELKRPGERPRPLQVRRITQLRALGCDARVIDSPDQIMQALDEIGGG